MRRLGACIAAMMISVLALTLWPDSDGARGEGEPRVLSLTHFERLSFDLRSRRLDEAERKTIEAAIAKDQATAQALYQQDVDAWLTKDALKPYVGAFFKFPPVAVVTPDAEPMFQRLARTADGPYYLPHKSACADGDVTTVDAWWSKTPIRICTSSYVPEKIFDEIGYCSGEAEPLMRQLPRASCGCGPMLMGCLPPSGENAALDALVRTSVADEWFETAANAVATDRPLDDLVTTSTTWQTGLAEVIYARREAIADHRKSKWGPALGKRIADRFKAIDVFAKGHWVKRKGVYEGTGLWWTSLGVASLKIPVRSAAHHLLDRHLCMAFNSVNVDADAVLAAVGHQEKNLRMLSSLTAAPMRTQEGCKGCHAPMDGAAGFMGEIEGPIYGSHPTGVRAQGEFFVAGGSDFRGKGVGSAALAKFVVKAPEFETCSVRRGFEQVLQRPVSVADDDLFRQLLLEFHKNGHRWRPVIRALLLSDQYLNQQRPLPAKPDTAPPTAVPAPVAKLVTDVCADCHDSGHKFDLTRVPEASDLDKWKKIVERVADYSMPPPKLDGSIAERFPIDPTVRRQFLAGLTKMLGPAIDVPQPPRRISHAVWMSVVRRVAEPALGRDGVSAILEPLIKKDGFFAKLPPRGLPPAYVLAVETASEAICRAVAKDKSNPYQLAAGAWSASAKSSSAGGLMTAIYGRALTQPELASELASIDSFHAVTNDWPEAWVAWCSTQLSGPRLFFADYIGGAR